MSVYLLAVAAILIGFAALGVLSDVVLPLLLRERNDDKNHKKGGKHGAD